MNQKMCDLCKKEMTSFDKVFAFSYGELSQNPFAKKQKGEVCAACMKAITKAIDDLKK